MKKSIKWKNKTVKKKYLQDLIEDTATEAADYNKNEDHSLGDFIKHFKFGFGFIQKITSQKKIEVFFKDSERTMLQNWQSS